MFAVTDIAFPIILLVLAGVGFGRFGVLVPNASRVLFGFVYFAALPAMLFTTLAITPLRLTLNIDYLIVTVGAQFALFGGSLVLASVLFPASAQRLSHHALAATLPASAFVGIPLMQLAFGPDGVLLAVLSALINAALIAPIATIVSKAGQQGINAWQRILVSTLVDLVRNPIFLAGAAGLLCAGFSLRLPPSIETPLAMIGSTAGPCALFALGLLLSTESPFMPLGELLWVSLLKIGLLPVMTFAFAVFLVPLTPIEMAVAVITAALPTSVTVYAMADRDAEFAGQTKTIIKISALGAAVTVSVLLTWFVPVT